MKKLLMVMLVLGSFSVFATERVGEHTTMASGTICNDVGKTPESLEDSSGVAQSEESQITRD